MGAVMGVVKNKNSLASITKQGCFSCQQFTHCLSHQQDFPLYKISAQVYLPFLTVFPVILTSVPLGNLVIIFPLILAVSLTLTGAFVFPLT